MTPPYKCFLKYQHFLTATEQLLSSSVVTSYQCVTQFSLSQCDSTSVVPVTSSALGAVGSGLLCGWHLTRKTLFWLQWAAGTLFCLAIHWTVLYFHFTKLAPIYKSTASAAYVFSVWIVEYIWFIAPSWCQKCRETVYWIFKSKSGPLSSGLICLLLCIVQGWFCWGQH